MITIKDELYFLSSVPCLSISRVDSSQTLFMPAHLRMSKVIMVNNLLLVQLASLEILVIGLLLVDVLSVSDQDLTEYQLESIASMAGMTQAGQVQPQGKETWIQTQQGTVFIYDPETVCLETLRLPSQQPI